MNVANKISEPEVYRYVYCGVAWVLCWGVGRCAVGVGVGWLQLLSTSFQFDAYAPTLLGYRQCLHGTGCCVRCSSVVTVVLVLGCCVW